MVNNHGASGTRRQVTTAPNAGYFRTAVSYEGLAQGPNPAAAQPVLQNR
jgi:hypothetical protein